MPDTIYQTNPSTGLERNEPSLRAWSIPQCPFDIQYDPAVLERIRQEIEAALRCPRGEHEVGGILFGQSEPSKLLILCHRPLRCEYAMGPGFVLSAADEQRLDELIAAPASDPELSGLTALGWYHSHTHSPVFLSERDLDIHNRHFPDASQIALVLRPNSDGYTRAGFFFRDSHGAIRADASYQEFSVKAPGAQTHRPRPATRETKPKSLEAAPACAKCGSVRMHRSRRSIFERLWAAAGLYPYRCEECLTRSLRRRSPGLLALTHARSNRRPEEKKRAWMRTRREFLLYAGGILGFLVFLLYLIRDTGPKADQP